MDFSPSPEQPESEPDARSNSSDQGLDRREFLKTLGKAGAATAATIWGIDKVSDLTKDNESLRYDGEKLSHKRKDVPTGELAEREGEQVNDLYKVYLGLSVNLDDVHDDVLEIPDVIKNVDFSEQLGALWSIKRKQNPEELTTVAMETGDQLIDEYVALTPNGVSIDEYSNEVDRVAEDLHDRLDWEELQTRFGLSGQKTQLARRICGEVGGTELLSYVLTELMPSDEGSLNRGVLDYLLQNAGREFVERIPAVYDGLTSFGPYQFTEKALFETPEEVRGASRLNEHVDGEKIPGSVSKLRGIEHHQAAYLLATKHIVELIQNLDKDGVAVLEAGWEDNMSDIAQFIAAAHNYPYGSENIVGALTSGQYWIDNNMEKDFHFSAGSRSREYAVKTKHNYKALT